MIRIDCNSQNNLFCRINDSCFRIEGGSVEEATNIFLKLAINLSYLI